MGKTSYHHLGSYWWLSIRENITKLYCIFIYTVSIFFRTLSCYLQFYNFPYILQLLIFIFPWVSWFESFELSISSYVSLFENLITEFNILSLSNTTTTTAAARAAACSCGCCCLLSKFLWIEASIVTLQRVGVVSQGSGSEYNN